jgi:hypothetical protein
MGAWLQEAGFAFTPELVRASLVLALVGSAVVVGLLARLGQSPDRHFFKLWMISWLFYTVHLGAATTLGALKQDVFSATVPTVAVALSALYMLAGILEMLQRPVPRRQLLLAALVLVGVTQVGSVAGRLPLIEAVAFDALALIAVLAGWAYYRHFQWRRNTTAIAAGFAVWAVPVVLTPSFDTSNMLA